MGPRAPGSTRRCRHPRRSDPRGRRPRRASTARGRRTSSTSAAGWSRRASSIRTVTRTGRCSSTARCSAISARASRPSCRATAATRWRRSPTSVARSSSCRCATERPRRPLADVRGVPRRRRRARARDECRVPRRARHGPRRRSSAPMRARPTTWSATRWSARSTRRMDAGAFGLSSGLIYAPGMHAARDELAALVTAATRRGGLYATHMRNEADELFDALDEAVATIRAAADAGAAAPRLQVSHLKCGSRGRMWPRRRGGRRAGGGPGRRSRRGGRPVPVHRRRDDARDDPAAGAARARRRRLRRGPRRS